MPEDTAELGISNPGRNKNLISPSEAIKRNPNFFKDRPETVNWTLRVKHSDGRVEELPPGTDWEAISRFGAVRSAVVTKPDGSPDYDRPRYEEAPSVNIVAWGKDKKTGEIKIGMIEQGRPHADNAFEPNSTDTMTFEQIPMGFLEKVVGKDQLESAHEGAVRETGEETGAKAVLDVSYPEYPQNYPNPTFHGNSSEVVFVEVDLDKIDQMKIDRSEQIFTAEYIPVETLLDDIKKGKTDRGYSRMAISNSAILVFLSNLNSFKNAQRNENILSNEGKANREFKKEDPIGYVKHRLRVSKTKHPEHYEESKRKAEAYLGRLYSEGLKNVTPLPVDKES